jgi:hypothetical protein
MQPLAAPIVKHQASSGHALLGGLVMMFPFE